MRSARRGQCPSCLRVAVKNAAESRSRLFSLPAPPTVAFFSSSSVPAATSPARTMASCGILSSKTVLVFLSFVFWAAAAVFCYAGAYVFITYDRYDHFFEDRYTILPALAIIVAGAVLLLIGVIGCWAAVRESRCALASFALLLLIIFSLEVAAVALGYIYHGKVEVEVQQKMHKAFQNYMGPDYDPESRAVDYMQKELQCCGFANYSDWNTTEWARRHKYNSVPLSCCKRSAKNCTGLLSLPAKLYQQGCLLKLGDEVQQILTYLIGVAVGFAFLQVMGLVAACVIACRRKHDENERAYEPLLSDGTYA
ncbi:tetraspanin-3-like [Petromyzon marinus]|uniref:tetraspanin-3-like n=1 Tax=Petromyzon marinus TaxID=7757 RepID=UPI003F70EEFC